LKSVHRFGIRKFVLMKTLHQSSPSWSRAIYAAFAFLCATLGFAPCGNSSPGVPRSWPSSQLTSQFAVADFDGDRRPDLAIVRVGQSSSWDTHYWIAFQLSGGSRQTLGITAPTGGLQIASRDVNGDDFLDVVIMTAWTNRPVAILLNDGRGNFKASDPSTFPAAFQTSRESWTCMTDEMKDAVALLLSRNVAGDCEEAGRVLSVQDIARLPISWTSDISTLIPIVSFFGRAPPSFLLHC
jgi:hypothetical protein